MRKISLYSTMMKAWASNIVVLTVAVSHVRWGTDVLFFLWNQNDDWGRRKQKRCKAFGISRECGILTFLSKLHEEWNYESRMVPSVLRNAIMETIRKRKNLESVSGKYRLFPTCFWRVGIAWSLTGPLYLQYIWGRCKVWHVMFVVAEISPSSTIDIYRKIASFGRPIPTVIDYARDTCTFRLAPRIKNNIDEPFDKRKKEKVRVLARLRSWAEVMELIINALQIRSQKRRYWRKTHVCPSREQATDMDFVSVQYEKACADSNRPSHGEIQCF